MVRLNNAAGGEPTVGIDIARDYCGCIEAVFGEAQRFGVRERSQKSYE